VSDEKSKVKLMESELVKMKIELEDLRFNYKELVKKTVAA
jgi:hypothetical protein